MACLTSDFAAGLSRRRGKGEPESAFGGGAGVTAPRISGPFELSVLRTTSFILLLASAVGETAVGHVVSALAKRESSSSFAL